MYNATTDDEEHLADDSDVSKNTDMIITIKLIIHLIKIDNLISSPIDFQQKCRLSVGLFFPK